MAVGVPKPLRLLAESAEDFRILSGLLQDSLLVPQQLRWQKKLGRFSLPLNRFCWEMVTDEHNNLFFRVVSELVIEGVVSVRHKGFDGLLADKKAQPQPFANLLAIELAIELPLELKEGPCLRLTFSQGLEICLWGEVAKDAPKVASPPPPTLLSTPPSPPPSPLPSPLAPTLRARLTDSREVQRTDKLPSHLS